MKLLHPKSLSIIHILSFTFIVFAFLPFSSGDIRLFGIPLAYIPMIFIFIGLILYHLIKRLPILLTKILYLPLFLLIVFISLNPLWVIDLKSWFIYYFMFIVYIFGLLSFVSYAKYSKLDMLDFTNKYIFLLVIVAIIALIKLPLILSGLVGKFQFTDLGLNPFSFMNKNFAIFMYVPFLSIAFFNYYKSQTTKSFWIFIVIFTTSYLIFSRSGMAAATFSVISTFSFLLLNKYYKNINQKILIYLSSFIVIIMIFLGDVIVSKFELMLNVFNILFGHIEVGGHDHHRTLIKEAALSIFKQNMFIGSGLGIENYVYYYPKGLFENDSKYLYTVAHNLYLTYSAQLGIVGFSILLYFFTALIYFFFKYSFSSNYELKIYARVFLVGHLTILIMFVGNEYITSPFPWFYWAIAIATINQLKNKYV